ncbi:PQQ-dependent sugar dehydrogenase [Terriglobus albidus]|uniref:PQQ-dependent sugar dehydrogenase n=1 Tax=Terriglobus albidus TaxID=1592106 RepID=UPI0021DFCFD8|nr:PQQ-dependent sugar dehydrogenase [Terriglobus albidus]
MRPVSLSMLLGTTLFFLSCTSKPAGSGDTTPPATPPATDTKTATSGCTSTLTGSSAFTDYTKQSPGVCHLITAADMPAPNTASSVTNEPTAVPRKSDQMPAAPAGFNVQLYAKGFSNARLLATAPNGDIFLADSDGDAVRVLHGVNSDGTAQTVTTFASGLNYPFGIAFYPAGSNPQYVYVANTDSVVRFPYQSGDATARGAAQVIVPSLPTGGHGTRTLTFTRDNRLLVSVGSSSNLANTDIDKNEVNRADVLAYTPDGTFLKQYATGLRNAVGLTTDTAGNIWASVNERDGLGENLPPDYVSRIREDGFYGWPWYYIGSNPDPRLPASHPELAGKTIVPDVLLQAHFAPLQIGFYSGTVFPSIYQGDLFVASHGSWNKSVRGGYEILRVILVNGQPSGYFEDFITGFVNSDGTVWGRPVGITTGADGVLYFSDDGSNSVWRVTWTDG